MSVSTLNKRTQKTGKTKRSTEAGFSMFEMMVAIIILTIGLLGMASAISYSLMYSNRGRNVTNAKMLVVSILEQMETLRDNHALTFAEISNTQQAGSTFTGFPYSSTAWRPVSTVPGRDGIFGTADDLWGATGTTDDPLLARPGVVRQIEITTFPSNAFLKKIKVTLRYQAAGGKQVDLVGISYLNDDSHGTYIP